MYSLIQSILGLLNFVDGIFMGYQEEYGFLGAFFEVDFDSEELFISFIERCARYEVIATLVITVLVVWLICKLICRIFDC